MQVMSLDKTKVLSKKITIDLTPIQLVWLHSQHQFQRIEEDALNDGYEIKFYKNNAGVELRYQKQPEDKNYNALQKAKKQLVSKIEENQLRLMRTSLHKDMYVRISWEARKQFPRSYIIFLHYETFENCCRKLRQKFSITSITVQLEKLRKQNPYFCFLVAEKNKIDQIEKFTDRLLQSQVSCASTTFSQKQRQRGDQSLLHYRRTQSVSSLKGSYASFSSQKQRNDLDHCRTSLQPSEAEQEMFQVSEVNIHNLTTQEINMLNRLKILTGTQMYIQNLQGNYSTMKKKLYYANRLQKCLNHQIQSIFAYSLIEVQSNKWKLSLVTDKCYQRFQICSEPHSNANFQNYKMKLNIFIQIAKALHWLHKHKQSYGDLNENNILLNGDEQILLSCIIDKNVPPHTNPVDYDIRQLIQLIYKTFSFCPITYDCLIKKLEKKRLLFTIVQKCKQEIKSQFLKLTNSLFHSEVNLEQFIIAATSLMNK